MAGGIWVSHGMRRETDQRHDLRKLAGTWQTRSTVLESKDPELKGLRVCARQDDVDVLR